MDLELNGKNIIVTGGTRGIGRAVAQTLAAEGANVAVCARNEQKVQETVAALQKEGVRATGAAFDVADGAALRNWIDSVAEEFGGLDAVVAGVSAFPFISTPENWRRGFEVDLMGTVNTIEAAVPHLEKSGVGSIVIISSAGGVEHWAIEGAMPYGPYKAALLHYTKGQANMLAEKGIRVNAVSPGATYGEGGPWHKIEQENPELFKTALALNPFGRMARPEESAYAVAFLVSPKASFISGTNLMVDGTITNRIQY